MAARRIFDRCEELACKTVDKLAVVADLTKAADVKRLIAETKRALGIVEIRVNNATWRTCGRWTWRAIGRPSATGR